MPIRSRLSVLVLAAGALAAADPVPPATGPQAWVEELRAANQARAALARESAGWTAERERLEAIIAATVAETARLAKEGADAEAAARASAEALTALGAGSDLDALRAQLAAGAGATRARLVALAATLPPGVLSVPAEGGERAFEAVASAIDAAERAAGGVAVEIVPGRLAGTEVAVKLLRIAGAAAWWVALDGGSAGTAQVRGGVLELRAESDPGQALAIRTALAVVEGRSPPAIVVLPLAAMAAVKDAP